ncbi:hypothetical protein RTBOTA2_003219 [Rhodotorula toruloides]|uniref:FGENESH: predicted gene_5.474 protein n=1 Tax=Rhodotorula toruloides TaxID=5286 RepID=A0A0K3CDS2_RHOTO|nr:hypothetical protein RTBOTA2_003219 [Rhodotorula toruloides]PRQ75263.1 hypothetical protein AAT19DRAFT_14285 [Rhodotorula toruloides]
MLRYFRTPGLRLTRSPKPPSRPVKPTKTRRRFVEDEELEYRFWRRHPEVVQIACDYFVHDLPTKDVSALINQARAVLTSAEQNLEIVRRTTWYDPQAIYKASEVREDAYRVFQDSKKRAEAFERHMGGHEACPSDIKDLLRRNQLEVLSLKECDKMDRWVDSWVTAAVRRMREVWQG